MAEYCYPTSFLPYLPWMSLTCATRSPSITAPPSPLSLPEDHLQSLNELCWSRTCPSSIPSLCSPLLQWKSLGSGPEDFQPGLFLSSCDILLSKLYLMHPFREAPLQGDDWVSQERGCSSISSTALLIREIRYIRGTRVPRHVTSGKNSGSKLTSKPASHHNRANPAVRATHYQLPRCQITAAVAPHGEIYITVTVEHTLPA